jgi:hypothetical protein
MGSHRAFTGGFSVPRHLTGEAALDRAVGRRWRGRLWVVVRGGWELALPEGFAYVAFSIAVPGDDRRNRTPRAHDGMAAFGLPDSGRIRLVHNHGDRDDPLVGPSSRLASPRLSMRCRPDACGESHQSRNSRACSARPAEAGPCRAARALPWGSCPRSGRAWPSGSRARRRRRCRCPSGSDRSARGR